MEHLYHLAQTLGEQLNAQGKTVTTAESCTGGGIAYCITDISGSSSWFEQAFVTYSNDAKAALVDVSPELIDRYGAVSEPVAQSMAEGALKRAESDFSIAVSGIAGPTGGSPEKPVGTVCFAWAERGRTTRVETCLFDGNRRSVRYQTIEHALNVLIAKTAL